MGPGCWQRDTSRYGLRRVPLCPACASRLARPQSTSARPHPEPPASYAVPHVSQGPDRSNPRDDGAMTRHSPQVAEQPCPCAETPAAGPGGTNQVDIIARMPGRTGILAELLHQLTPSGQARLKDHDGSETGDHRSNGHHGPLGTHETPEDGETNAKRRQPSRARRQWALTGAPSKQQPETARPAVCTLAGPQLRRHR